MINNFDPFYGEVQYFKGTDLGMSSEDLLRVPLFGLYRNKLNYY